jgi:hypothetical protein
MLTKNLLPKMLMKSSPEVNFTNILQATFATISFFQKITSRNCKHGKAAKICFCMKKAEHKMSEILFEYGIVNIGIS